MKLPLFMGLMSAFACGFLIARAASQDVQAKVYKMSGTVVRVGENRVDFRDSMGQEWQFDKSQGFSDRSEPGKTMEIQYVMSALTVVPKEGMAPSSPPKPTGTKTPNKSKAK